MCKTVTNVFEVNVGGVFTKICCKLLMTSCKWKHRDKVKKAF